MPWVARPARKAGYAESMAQRGSRDLSLQTTLGERVAAARHDLGLTQRELAARVGVPLGILATWEAGRAAPGARLQRLAEALGRPVEWLLGGFAVPSWPAREPHGRNGETAAADAPARGGDAEAERAELEVLRQELDVASRELEVARRELESGRNALEAYGRDLTAGRAPAAGSGAARELGELRSRLAEAEARAQETAAQLERSEQELEARRAQLEEEFTALAQRQAAGLAARKQELLRLERQLAAWQSKLEQAGVPVPAPEPDPSDATA